MNGKELKEQQVLLGTRDLIESVDLLRISLGFNQVATITPIVELKLRHGLLPARDLVLVSSPWNGEKSHLEITPEVSNIMEELDEIESPNLVEDEDEEDFDDFDDEDDEDEEEEEEKEEGEEAKEQESEKSTPLAADWHIKMTFKIGYPIKYPCTFTVLTPGQAKYDVKPQPIAVIEEDFDDFGEEEEDEDEEENEEEDEEEEEIDENKEKKLKIEAKKIEKLLNYWSEKKKWSQSHQSMIYSSPLDTINEVKKYLKVVREEVVVEDLENKDENHVENEELVEGVEEVKLANKFTCRLCRKLLFTSDELSDHSKNFLVSSSSSLPISKKPRNPCTSLFLEDAPRFFTPQDLADEEGGGKILCPHCKARCGSWTWVGSACSCGEWLAPSFQFVISRVDQI